MEDTQLKQFASALGQSTNYRVIEKYRKPQQYNPDDLSPKLIGIFLDVETTGLDSLKDKIIELGIVCFEYSADGRIFRILNEISWYQDPGMPIPSEITELTGISDDMVKGQTINQNELEKHIKSASLIIAHNAEFDRSFFETRFPNLPKRAWCCLMKDINWRSEGIESTKLEYIAYKFGFFYEGHRAAIDCLAGIHVLSHILPKSGQLVFSTLLTKHNKISFKIAAVGAPYDKKDILKKRGYRWIQWKSNAPHAWCIDVDRENIESELNFLWSEIFLHPVKLPIEILDAHTRFSKPSDVVAPEKYKDIREWLELIQSKAS